MNAEYTIVTAGEPLHSIAFAYASHQFQKFFNAELKKPSYRYAIVTNEYQHPKAVLAIRPLCETERTLSEHYLRCTAHEWLLENHGVAIEREHLVEVGSLACNCADDAVGLLKFAAIYGELIGLKYTILTATKPVRLLMRKMGFEFSVACSADATMASGFSDDSWGNYYSSANNPKVCILKTQQLFEQSQPWLQQHGTTVAKLSLSLPSSTTETPNALVDAPVKAQTYVH